MRRISSRVLAPRSPRATRQAAVDDMPTALAIEVLPGASNSSGVGNVSVVASAGISEIN
jgi:hypothetical protein